MLHNLPNKNWNDVFSTTEQQIATQALENGQVIYLPQLSFQLTPTEQALLSPLVLSSGFKNVSFTPQRDLVKGSNIKDTPDLKTMMCRFFNYSQTLIHNLIPYYKASIINGRTSYRPAAVAGRKTSILKDDTRLHVDAFTATPNHGKRILRVFSNINPNGESRVWHLGEPFADVVKQFLPKLSKPWPGSRKILSMLKITKTYRSLYDHYMLMLHDQMKQDTVYQQNVKKIVAPFPAGSTWIVMTDSVSHAAISGQFLLEQTFYLEPENMQNPKLSPLYILENALKQNLLG